MSKYQQINHGLTENIPIFGYPRLDDDVHYLFFNFSLVSHHLEKYELLVSQVVIPDERAIVTSKCFRWKRLQVEQKNAEGLGWAIARETPLNQRLVRSIKLINNFRN